MQKHWLTLLNYNTGEVNVFEFTEETEAKWQKIPAEDFIRDIVGLDPDEVSWMITIEEPFVTKEVLSTPEYKHNPRLAVEAVQNMIEAIENYETESYYGEVTEDDLLESLCAEIESYKKKIS